METPLSGTMRHLFRSGPTGFFLRSVGRGKCLPKSHHLFSSYTTFSHTLYYSTSESPPTDDSEPSTPAPLPPKKDPRSFVGKGRGTVMPKRGIGGFAHREVIKTTAEKVKWNSMFAASKKPIDHDLPQPDQQEEDEEDYESNPLTVVEDYDMSRVEFHREWQMIHNEIHEESGKPPSLDPEEINEDELELKKSDKKSARFNRDMLEMVTEFNTPLERRKARDDKKRAWWRKVTVQYWKDREAKGKPYKARYPWPEKRDYIGNTDLIPKLNLDRVPEEYRDNCNYALANAASVFGNNGHYSLKDKRKFMLILRETLEGTDWETPVYAFPEQAVRTEGTIDLHSLAQGEGYTSDYDDAIEDDLDYDPYAIPDHLKQSGDYALDRLEAMDKQLKNLGKAMAGEEPEVEEPKKGRRK